MTAPIVFGAPYSVYLRAVRLALEEKGVPYRLEEVDIFADGGPPEDYLARHPFARIPAFEHDGFGLYETNAISHYVDEAFDGPALLPDGPRRRARTRSSAYSTTTLIGPWFGTYSSNGSGCRKAAARRTKQRSRRRSRARGPAWRRSKR